MGSTSITLTTTTTPPAAPTTITSGSETRQGGSETTPGGGTNATDAQTIRDAFDAALHQTGPGGPAGGGPGGPGGGAPLPIPIAHLVPIAANPDVHVMGSPPRIFNGDRQQADVFLNKLLTYICINIGVPGFKSPLRKIALALTYIKGDKVNRWAKSVAQWWDSLDPVAHNVHYTWLHFLTAFRQQFLNHTNQQ